MYTKGEWKIGNCGNHRFEVLSDRRIAVVDTQDDVYLIAAAPDMYRALENLIFQVSNNSVPYSQIKDAIIQGRQALAKAENSPSFERKGER